MTNQNTINDLNRRGFFKKILMGIGIAVSYGTGAVYGLQFLLPAKKKAQFRKILVASINDIPKDSGKTFKDLQGREMILVNTNAGLKAISTTCTHLGCKAYWEIGRAHV